MKNANKRIIAALSAILMCVPAVSCSSKKSSEAKKSEAASSESKEILSGDENSAEAPSETNGTASSADEKEEPTSEKKSDNTEETDADSEIAAATQSGTEAATENKSESDSGGYTSSIDIAQDFYNAYLSRDAEKIYAMFDNEEIRNYSKLIEGELDGKSADEVFSKQAVTNAIGASMDSIGEIMAAYSDSDSDKWSVSVTSDDMETADEKSLESFNGDLKTSYSAAVIINYIYYENETNGETFTGNSCAFLEKNGKWYLSYSSLMQSELLNYLEV